MLQVAAATCCIVWAGRLDAIRARLDDGFNFAAGKFFGFLNQANAQHIARSCFFNKNWLAIQLANAIAEAAKRMDGDFRQ